MKLFFHPKAEEELKESILYYEKCQKSLGEKFLKEINKVIERIKLFPYSCKILLLKDIRRCLVNKFPYGIVYFIENERIVILAIMHLIKKPEYWKDRL